MSVLAELESEFKILVAKFEALFRKAERTSPTGTTGATGPKGP